MNIIDWIVLLGTLGFIALYGAWKTKGQKAAANYFKGSDSVPWWTIGLSVMATQASAITFMSTPGQAFEDGMRFIQFYFGLPIAMIILCVSFLPKYMKLNVYTAYEFLEQRFDYKTRLLSAVLFLIQRGLAAGITIYAPAIILSTVLNWNLNATIALTGAIVIAYTVGGGSAAVSQTQKQQMTVILLGMAIAFGLIIHSLPADLSFGRALNIAGKMGKMNIVDFSFNINDRYNFWSGITGGLFLALSYFGTDQSQVARYISGSSLSQSRMGLIFNGLVKIPMQFGILLTGVLVYVFFLFQQAPVFFNEPALKRFSQDKVLIQHQDINKEIHQRRQTELSALQGAMNTENERAIDQHTGKLKELEKEDLRNRKLLKDYIKSKDSGVETKDSDYVFLHFILGYLPHGLIGLLLAVILSAAMSSTSSEINALASTTAVDIFRWRDKLSNNEELLVKRSKWLTVLWGIMAISFALISSLFDNLIEAVNILGSLFYGTVLGIFLVAFYLKKVGGTAVFTAALIAEAVVILCFFAPQIADTLHTMKLDELGLIFKAMGQISFLWYNVLGCLLVCLLSLALSSTKKPNFKGRKPV